MAIFRKSAPLHWLGLTLIVTICIIQVARNPPVGPESGVRRAGNAALLDFFALRGIICKAAITTSQDRFYRQPLPPKPTEPVWGTAPVPPRHRGAG
ncbi:MAG: hypothetical protein KME26_29595 [Oscillatoria princeps RMCB-10]|nr:hypothetical protein [Oscillatoria princeps RMCB-10]